MNEAMPRWRTFTSGGPASPASEPSDGEGSVSAVAPSHTRPFPDVMALVAAALGGAAAGAAGVMLAGLLLGSTGGAGSSGAVGQPLTDRAGALDGPLSRGVAAGLAATDSMDGVPRAEIVVDIAGAVERPGLLRLRAGDRVGDAIQAAGGFGPRVDLAEAGRSLNLAQPLSDGIKVLVPELGVDGPRQTKAEDGRIDLNEADQAALESLPGIGPVTAGKIIEARSQQRFTSVQELLARDVVGEAVFEDIEALVHVSG